MKCERLIARASSPPVAPPARTQIPAPTPTKSAPATAASNGLSASCVQIGGNFSKIA